MPCAVVVGARRRLVLRPCGLDVPRSARIGSEEHLRSEEAIVTSDPPFPRTGAVFLALAVINCLVLIVMTGLWFCQALRVSCWRVLALDEPRAALTDNADRSEAPEVLLKLGRRELGFVQPFRDDDVGALLGWEVGIDEPIPLFKGVDLWLTTQVPVSD